MDAGNELIDSQNLQGSFLPIHAVSQSRNKLFEVTDFVQTL